MKMKILIGCPTFGIDPDPRRWMTSMLTASNEIVRMGGEVNYCFPYRKGVCDADNQIVKTAIAIEADYILRLDDDIWGVQRGDITKLLEADKEFISAVTFTNDFPYALMAGNKKDKSMSLKYIRSNDGNFLDEITGHGIQTCDLTATPFTLWKVSMFDKFLYPFFVKEPECPPDSTFCDKCAGLGIQPYVHMDIQLNHREVTPWNRLHLFNSRARELLMKRKLDPTTAIYKKMADMFGEDGLKDLLSLKGTLEEGKIKNENTNSNLSE